MAPLCVAPTCTAAARSGPRSSASAGPSACLQAACTAPFLPRPLLATAFKFQQRGELGVVPQQVPQHREVQRSEAGLPMQGGGGGGGRREDEGGRATWQAALGVLGSCYASRFWRRAAA